MEATLARRSDEKKLEGRPEPDVFSEARLAPEHPSTTAGVPLFLHQRRNGANGHQPPVPQVPAARTGVSRPPGDKTVIQREVAEVTADPTIRAHQPPGQPVILAPPAMPPSPAQQADAARAKMPGPAQAAAPKPLHPAGQALDLEAAKPGGPSAHGAPGAAPAAHAAKPVHGRHSAAHAAHPAHPAHAKQGAAHKAHAAHGGHAPGPKGRSGAKRTGTAVALVPPAAPEVLRAQIPQRAPTYEEFEQTLLARRSPAEDRAQAQAILGTLRADAEQEKRAIAGAVAWRQHAVAADAVAKSAFVRAMAAGHRSAIHTHFGAEIAKLQQQAVQKKAQVQVEIAKDVATSTAAGAEAVAAAQAQGGQRKSAIASYAEQQSRQPNIIADQESARAASELETAAQECKQAGRAEAARYPGEDDPAPKQRSAAREVGDQSAADVREKKSDIGDDLRSRAADFGGHYTEYSDALVKQIDDALGQLIPALLEAATDTSNTIRQSTSDTLHAIDSRLHTDLDALHAAESAVIAQIANAEHATVEQIHRQAERMEEAIDDAGHGLDVAIDRSVEEVAAVINGEELPHIPGIRDIVEGGRLKVRTTSETGRSSLGHLESGAREDLAASVSAFERGAGHVLAGARSATAGIALRNAQALGRTMQGRAQQAAAEIAGLRSRQQKMTAGVIAEIDRAAEKARGELRGINDKFRSETRDATDEAIDKAKKPRTDTVETRVAEAADQADESWVWGALRALGSIVAGLVVLVLVALVVAFIAALFGVLLTAWTAIMIAGALLLVIGLVVSLIHRLGQKELAGHPFKAIGIAFLDTVGVTGIYESGMLFGWGGHDIVTGRALSDAERTERGILGVFTLVSIALGARAAIKGPGPSGYFRPESLKWPGFGEFFSRSWDVPKGWESVQSVAGDMYKGLLKDGRGAIDWIRKLFTKEETPPPPQPQQQPPQQPQPQQQQPQQQQPPVPPGPARPVYDPAVRTMPELHGDIDPTPRPGETPQEAAQRSAAAQEELLRRQVAIYDALGDTPRQVDVRADDLARRGPGAHTIRNHGAGITLEMPRDAAGNRMPVPTGVKSIEGRIGVYDRATGNVAADTGWADPENSSFRWKSDRAMNDTVNQYIRDNWAQIRSDLATTGQHSANFNNPSGAIGEGFFNPNQGLPGGGTVNRGSAFMETSLVRITIRLIPGPPPDFYIVTTFPNALGAPAY